MSKSPNEIAARMVAQLNQSAPGLSTERGTVVRKIIDACSEAVSEAYVDQYLVGSILDIDTKVGLELEQFVGLRRLNTGSRQRSSAVVKARSNTPCRSMTTVERSSATAIGGGPIWRLATTMPV